MSGLGEGPLASGAIGVEAFVPGLAEVVSEGLHLGQTLAFVLRPGNHDVEAFRIGATVAASQYGAGVLADHVKTGMSAQVTWPVALAQALGLQASVPAPKLGAAIVSTVRVGGKALSAMTWGLKLADRLSLLAAAACYAHLAFADGLHVGPSASYAYSAGVAIAERFALDGGLGHQVVLRLAVTTAFDVADYELLRFVWSAGIDETIQASVLYQSLGDNVATWAINTRTNAVTQYANFSFNSFAMMGRKYLAADSQGLYELNGSRDLTQNVASELASGFFAAGGSNVGGFKAAYIGMRASGEFLLKLEAGDGRRYVYRALPGEGLRTTKVNLGKGLRARYFAWELLADGPDYEIDAIEFVPMVSARRV